MAERAHGRHTLPIAVEDDVVIVRRKVRQLAERMGFDLFSIAALTTAASELTRNTWQHGLGGTATLEEVSADDGRPGLRMTFEDHGPGIGDLEQALESGFSTRRSLGLGLSGSQRLVDHFRIESTPGEGTRVVATKWARYPTGR